MTDYKEIKCQDRRTWRLWLERNHAELPGIWLVYYKKHTGKPSVTYNEAVEEALCFGWIDSKVQRLDEEQYRQVYTPRNSRSVWSQANKDRVKRMIEAGKMTPAGMERVEAAKRSGEWKKTSGSPPAKGEMHPDFGKALKRNKKARQFFESLAPTYQGQYLWWIADAKRDETRARRIKKLIERLKQGKKPGIP